MTYRGFTSPAIYLGGLLAASLTVLGCAIIGGPSVTGTLSENMALVDLGAESNAAAFNDGNRFTSAATRTAMVGPEDPNWMEAEKYTEGQVIFPEVTPIHKIRVHSKDLDRQLQQGMFVSVDYLKATGEWRTLRQWDRSPVPRDPVVNCEVEGKGVRVRIKRPSSMFTGGTRGPDSDTGERTVYEIEVFKYIQDEPSEEGAEEASPSATS